MTEHAKRLKNLLKKHSISGSDPDGKLSVRTEKIGEEWGDAVAYTRLISDSEELALREENEWVRINSYPRAGFSVARL